MRTLCIIFLAILVVGCNKTHKQQPKQPNYTLKIVYNVLTDEDNDNYEVFTMDLDGSNKKNVTNFKGVEWSYYSQDDDLYFVSDKDTTARKFFLYKMKADGSQIEQLSDVRLTDSWQSSRNEGSEYIIRPHSSVDTAFYVIKDKKVFQKLKPNLKYLSDPTYSPDGSQIVFRGANAAFKKDEGYIDELYIMNADGSNLRQLTHYPKTDTTAQWYSYHAGPPKWHPTEGYITYGSKQNAKYSIFAITPDGKKQWQLIPEKATSTVWHSWSPDGKWLVFDFSIDDKAPFHIALMNWETKKTKVLTDSTYNYHQAPHFIKVYN